MEPNELSLSNICGGAAQEVFDRELVEVLTLYPFRTFEEVAQPASKFLFRLRSVSPECPPECALFLADGEGWKWRAMQTVKEYLETKLGDDYVVIA